MIILGSKSPRRKELLSLITPNFIIDVPEVDESLNRPSDPYKVPEYLSLIKAQEIFSRHQDDIVIASDTVVIINENIIKYHLKFLHMLSQITDIFESFKGKEGRKVTDIKNLHLYYW